MSGPTDFVVDYIHTRYGSNRNRHWWGIAHRARLIDSGEYIKTSQRPHFRVIWKKAESRPHATISRSPAACLAHSHGWTPCQCHNENS